jgi:predicted nucleic-acid-binding protein
VIGLDTNVVIRYLAQDDPEQSAAASRLIESLDEREPGFISIAVVVEIGWVLTRSYGVDRDTLAEAFDRLLSSRELLIQHSESVRAALDKLRAGGDFADAIIADLGRHAGCHRTLTFDRRAARRSGMELIQTNLS